MSKALAVLKLFFSLISVNSTESPSSVSNSTSGVTRSALSPTSFTLPTFFKLEPTVTVGRPFRISITQDLKSDISEFSFEMKTYHYGDIRTSSWIQFDKRTREVYGFPLPGNAGRFFYKFIVSNSTRSSLLAITFELRVRANGFEYSHEVDFKMGTKFNYLKFMTNLHMRFDFARKLARYSFNEKPSTIWIKNFNKNARVLTIVFVNIPYSPCLETTYRELHSKFVDENSNITANFQKAMTETFPIERAMFKFFGACDSGLLGPGPPFEWGVLKHVIPLAMIFTVVGIPVGISCYVNKRRRKPQVVEERRRRTLRPRYEDEIDFTSHTVHFNNRYPSMLSVSNNSKEDNVGDDEKGHSPKSNIPNGSPASRRHLTVPNAVPNRPKQGANSTNTDTVNNTKNPFKFASNEERANFDVRAMWDDDDDSEPTPLNIPTYYTHRKNESTEEEASMRNVVFDMNFSNIAENISSKLKGVKSMLNIQSETAAQEATTGPSLTTKIKGLGKSMLNLSTATKETSVLPGTSFSEASAPSLSTQQRYCERSTLNVSVRAENDGKSDFSEMPKASYQDFEDSASLTYTPQDKLYQQAKRRSWPDAGQSYDEARQHHDKARLSYDSVRRDHHSTRQSHEGAHQNHHRARYSHDDARQVYDSTCQNHYPTWQGFDGKRQDHDRNRQNYDSARLDQDHITHSYEGARRDLNRKGNNYDSSRRVYDDAKQSHDYARKGFNHPRKSYDDSRRGNHKVHQQHNFKRDGSSQYGNHRCTNSRYSGDTSEYELAQYNFQGQRRSPTLEYLPEEDDVYRQSPAFKSGRTQRKWSREHDFDEYPASLFNVSSDLSLKSEHEKSIFDTDYCDVEEKRDLLVKPTPVRNLSPLDKACEGSGKTSVEMKDIRYRQNTYPHQQTNGPTRIPHGKYPYNVTRTRSYSSQSSLEFWDVQGFDGDKRWNTSSNPKTEVLSTFRNTLPADLRRENYKGSIPNGTKPQSKSKQNQGNSIRSGSLLPGEKPPVVYTLGDSDEEEYRQQNQHQQQQQQQQNRREQQRQQNQQPENKSSLVGLIKTGVSSILEPDGNVSKWLSGFQKNDSSVT